MSHLSPPSSLREYSISFSMTSNEEDPSLLLRKSSFHNPKPVKPSPSKIDFKMTSSPSLSTFKNLNPNKFLEKSPSKISLLEKKEHFNKFLEKSANKISLLEKKEQFKGREVNRILITRWNTKYFIKLKV